MPFEPRTLGRTGLETGAIGVAASYGADAGCVQFAFDHGVNYFYWGSMRRSSFGEGLKRLPRDRYFLTIQSYSRVASLIPGSLERALRQLNTDYCDVLLLGMWNRAVPERILDGCRRLKDRGKVRFLAVSTHQRTLVPKLVNNPDYDIFHVRYNAKHTGAERDIFAHLSPSPAGRPGIVSFTNTSWGQLLDPKRTPKSEQPLTATDCYRFALTNPAVDLCMSGPKNLEQTRSAIRALELGPLAEDEMARIRRIGASMYGSKPEVLAAAR